MDTILPADLKVGMSARPAVRPAHQSDDFRAVLDVRHGVTYAGASGLTYVALDGRLPAYFRPDAALEVASDPYAEPAAAVLDAEPCPGHRRLTEDEARRYLMGLDLDVDVEPVRGRGLLVREF